MKLSILPLALIALASISPAHAEETLPPGIWTNTEDSYFAEEEGRVQREWFGVEVGEDGRWRKIDAFAVPQGDWETGSIPDISPREGGGWQVLDSELRRARSFYCWVAVRKFAGKPDGSEDWTFKRNIPIFDQGGRIFIEGSGIAPDVTVRLRNVTWAKGSPNKPVMALYIHKEDPVRAVSYSWAANDSRMVGINLRWVQASCSLTESQAMVS